MNLIILGLKTGALIAVAYITFTLIVSVAAGILNAFKRKDNKNGENQ